MTNYAPLALSLPLEDGLCAGGTRFRPTDRVGDEKRQMTNYAPLVLSLPLEGKVSADYIS